MTKKRLDQCPSLLNRPNYYITTPAFYITAPAFYITAPAFYITAPAFYITAPAFYITAPAMNRTFHGSSLYNLSVSHPEVIKIIEAHNYFGLPKMKEIIAKLQEEAPPIGADPE